MSRSTALRAGYRSGSWGWGVRAPGPGRNDGLDVLLRPLGAEDVAVIGPVRDQAGQGRVSPSFHRARA